MKNKNKKIVEEVKVEKPVAKEPVIEKKTVAEKPVEAKKEVVKTPEVKKEIVKKKEVEIKHKIDGRKLGNDTIYKVTKKVLNGIEYNNVETIQGTTYLLSDKDLEAQIKKDD